MATKIGTETSRMCSLTWHTRTVFTQETPRVLRIAAGLWGEIVNDFWAFPGSIFFTFLCETQFAGTKGLAIVQQSNHIMISGYVVVMAALLGVKPCCIVHAVN